MSVVWHSGTFKNTHFKRSRTADIRQAWDEDSPLVLEDEDFQNCEDEDEDEDSVL